MAFRNEHDAQRARIQALEGDLARAREKLQQRDDSAAAAEERAGELERELEQARKELARLGRRPGQPGRHKPVALVALTLGALVTAGAALFVTVSVDSEPIPAVRPLPRPAPLDVSPPEPEPASPAVAENVSVVHEAQVREAHGWPTLRPGDRCQVESTLRLGPERLGVARVAVRCGETVLYDSAAPATGFVVASTSGQAFERRAAGGGQRNVYTVIYQDQGMRALPQTQLVLNTQTHRARVFRSPESEGSVTLDIVEQWSEPREGEPLLAESARALAFDEELSAELVLRSVQGAAPLRARPRPSCTLRVQPELDEAPNNCRVLVRCEGELLYGADTTGYARCEVDDEGRVVRATDPSARTDGDPELHFDREAGTLRLRDELAAGEWTARFQLAPAR